MYSQNDYNAYNRRHRPRVVYQYERPVGGPYLGQNNPYAQGASLPQVIQPISPVDGFLISEDYEPERGDPVVVEQAVFKGEVVKAGDKQKEVINEGEAILVGEGYASEDGKHWKHVPKIMMNVFKLGQLQIREVTKVKARYEPSLPHYKLMKVTIKEKDYFLAYKEAAFNQWFLRLVWAKLILEKRECSDFGHWEPEIAGKIYRKSFVMGDWEPRLVTIDARSLRVQKDGSSAVGTEVTGTKEIWTRFEEVRGGYYLVVKLWNGILKEEFAVPTAFCLHWLHHFLGLLTVK
jgi:hypothetical protein